MTTYKLSDSNPGNIKEQDVHAVGAALQNIAEANGYIDNALIVKAAKPKTSALHQYVWEVDPDDALDECRRTRAGRVRRSVLIEVVSPVTREVVSVPQYFISTVPTTTANKPPASTKFMDIEDAMTDEQKMEIEGDRVLGYVYSYRNRLSLHPRFAKLIEEMDALMNEVKNRAAVAVTA